VRNKVVDCVVEVPKHVVGQCFDLH
jgi:hypothetical protein